MFLFANRSAKVVGLDSFILQKEYKFLIATPDLT